MADESNSYSENLNPNVPDIPAFTPEPDSPFASVLDTPAQSSYPDPNGSAEQPQRPQPPYMGQGQSQYQPPTQTIYSAPGQRQYQGQPTQTAYSAPGQRQYQGQPTQTAYPAPGQRQYQGQPIQAAHSGSGQGQYQGQPTQTAYPAPGQRQYQGQPIQATYSGSGQGQYQGQTAQAVYPAPGQGQSQNQYPGQMVYPNPTQGQNYHSYSQQAQTAYSAPLQGQSQYQQTSAPFGDMGQYQPPFSSQYQSQSPSQSQSQPQPQPSQMSEEDQTILNEESMLSPQERKAVDDFAQKINILDSNMVLQYGAAAQKNIAGFSESALNSVRTKDLGEIGKSLSDLVAQLQEFGDDEEEEKRGFFGRLKKSGDKVSALKAQYSKVETNIDRIVRNLEQHQVTLMKDVAMFDQMYELNLRYYKELTMYILAGKKKMRDVKANELEQMRRQAERTGSPEDAQRYNDMIQMCNRFEKKLHDLELTRMISIQMGPQTRLLQNNDSQLVEKIQSSLVNTIPLWKSQMVLALGLEHSRQATEDMEAVTEMTNRLLRSNADKLKMGTIQTARASERSIVDIETLQHANQQLISTLDEVLTIQQEGAQKRREAEIELGRIENELKSKLMELHR